MVMWRDFAVSRLWDLYSREQVEGKNFSFVWAAVQRDMLLLIVSSQVEKIVYNFEKQSCWRESSSVQAGYASKSGAKFG